MEQPTIKGITILKALYGSKEQLEGGTAHDVTEAAKKYLVEGKLVIENPRQAFGDPHPNYAKFFRITYLKDGKSKSKDKPYEFEYSGGSNKIELAR